MKKNQTLMNVNLILSCATAVMYTTYLALKREVRLLIIMVGAYSVLYLLTNNSKYKYQEVKIHQKIQIFLNQ